MNTASLRGRDILALAHTKMTRAEVAANALALCDVIESYRDVVDARGLAMVKAAGVVETMFRAAANTVAQIKEVDRLFKSHRKLEARRMLDLMADAVVTPIALPEVEDLPPIPATLWNPKAPA